MIEFSMRIEKVEYFHSEVAQHHGRNLSDENTWTLLWKYAPLHVKYKVMGKFLSPSETQFPH